MLKNEKPKRCFEESLVLLRYERLVAASTDVLIHDKRELMPNKGLRASSRLTSPTADACPPSNFLDRQTLLMSMRNSMLTFSTDT